MHTHTGRGRDAVWTDEDMRFPNGKNEFGENGICCISFINGNFDKLKKKKKKRKKERIE